MFLIERAVSLLTYGAILYIAYVFVSGVKKTQYKFVIWSYLVVLCIFAFSFKPHVTADLYRLRLYMQYWVNRSWSDIIPYALSSSTPTWILYSFVVNKLGNINWLQTLACLWTYYCIFFIIVHETERNDLKGHQRGLLLLFIMAVGMIYIDAISGIRGMLSMATVAFCVYNEIVEEKSTIRFLHLYLFAALFHSLGMAMVIGRFIFLLIQYKDIKKKILVLVVLIGLGAFSAYYLRDYISGSYTKALSYIQNENEYVYLWEGIIGALETLQTLLILRVYRKTKYGTEGAEQNSAIWKYCTAWTAISLISIPFSFAIFRRSCLFCSIICVPLLAEVLKDEQFSESINIYHLGKQIRVLSFIIFVLSVVRGNLCGYKFFVL